MTLFRGHRDRRRNPEPLAEGNDSRLESLFFCDIASPQTRRNLERNDWIELNVVDTLSRRGYRFLGRGSIHVDDEIYREATSRIREEEGREYEVDSVILVRIERVRPLISPGYEYVADEWAMREGWKEKRQWLDREFESHLDRHGALRGRVYTRGTPPASDQEAE